MEDNDRDYFILVICYERSGVYSHSVRVEKSRSYDVIEEWSRTGYGLCEVIDMKRIARAIRDGSIGIV